MLFPLVACGGSDDDNSGDLSGGDLTCSVSSIEAPAVGGTYTVNVSSERGEWTSYTTCTDWIKLSNANTASKNGTVTVKIEKNSTTAARDGSITVKSGINNVVIPVKQSAPLQVSKTEVFSISAGESITVEVTAAGTWTAESAAEWAKVTQNGNTLTITTEANDALKSRSTTITIKAGEETATINVQQDSAEDRDINAPEGYRLVWHDEFNEGSVLSNEWRHEVQNSGWVNNELQNYRNGTADGKRVTELIDGKLKITCFKGSDGKIYSGRIYACENPGIKYGYIEARIKLPKGKGTWPAFWMMPCNVDWAIEGWPKCGEIDIMEEVGCVPNEVSSSLHAEGHNHTNGTQVTAARMLKNAEGEFHTYAIEWTKDNITTYVDGECLLSYDNDGKGVRNWPYDKPYYIILNLAWGGAWGGMNGVDESALPVTMEVDYVRVFQK